jgi:hypothetical protein
VRYEDDAQAVVGQASDEVEDLLGLGDAERRSWLVEDDQLGVPQHRAGDGNRLPLAAGEAGHLLAHRFQRPNRQPFQRLLGPPFHRDLVKRDA